MAEAIHITHSTEKPLEERTWFRNTKAVAAVFRWMVIVVLAIGGYYIYQRDVNAATAVNVTDLDRRQKATETRLDKLDSDTKQKIELIETKMLTRELYEAYHKLDAEKMDRMEQSLERIAARP